MAKVNGLPMTPPMLSPNARLKPTTTQTTLTTAADALHGEEIARTRLLLKLGWIIAMFVAGAVLALPGEPRIGRALLGTLGITVIGSVWTFLQMQNPANYDARQLNVLAFAAIVCGELGILYVGIFSAAPLIVAGSVATRVEPEYTETSTPTTRTSSPAVPESVRDELM